MFEVGQEPGEESLAAGVIVGGGVVVLGLQGGNSMVVAKKVQVSQTDSKGRSSAGGRVQ